MSSLYLWRERPSFHIDRHVAPPCFYSSSEQTNQTLALHKSHSHHILSYMLGTGGWFCRPLNPTHWSLNPSWKLLQIHFTSITSSVCTCYIVQILKLFLILYFVSSVECALGLLHDRLPWMVSHFGDHLLYQQHFINQYQWGSHWGSKPPGVVSS